VRNAWLDLVQSSKPLQNFVRYPTLNLPPANGVTKQRASPNCFDYFGSCPLHTASLHGADATYTHVTMSRLQHAFAPSALCPGAGLGMGSATGRLSVFAGATVSSSRGVVAPNVVRRRLVRVRMAANPPDEHDVHAVKGGATNNAGSMSLQKPDLDLELDLDLNSDEERKRRDVGRLLRLFGRLSVPYLEHGPRAKWDAAGVLGMTLLQNGVSVGISFISRDFWSALNTKNAELFQHQAFMFFLVLIGCVPIITLGQYIRDMSANRWRTWMTETVLKQYMANRSYYQIDQEATLDNPDQRISSDLAAFTSESLSFMLSVVTSAIDIVSFSAILWSIYPPLFLVLIGYSFSGTALTLLLGKSFVALNRRQLSREADLRFSLVRLRENSESIAFYNGESRELAELQRRLALAVGNAGALIGWQAKLGVVQTGYRYAVQLVPALVVAPRYFAGAIELGTVTQSFGAFSHIFGDLSLIVNRFDSLAQLGAQVGRIEEITSAVEASIAVEDLVFSRSSGQVDVANIATGTTIEQRVSSDGSLILENVSLSTPGGNRELVSNVSLSLREGERLLIVGPSGCGKSSTTRAIAGLWTRGSGVITRPTGPDIFFLPQRPYMTLGSLRSNILYPMQEGDAGAPSDADLCACLNRVDLASLADRSGGLDATKDWGDTLSLGEQQRLSFARLLIAKPKLAVIDEGTSALDIPAETRLYEALKDRGITVVSVGHRPSLLNFHDRILRLGRGDDSSWTAEMIAQEQRDKLVSQVL
jgi:vitamin B12/bleomycin/antimicrobial peptide transport system ATP-binding/permease protein